MRLAKKSAALLLCSALSLALFCGCGKAPANTEATTPSETSESSARQTSPAPDIDYVYYIVYDIESAAKANNSVLCFRILSVREGLYRVKGYACVAANAETLWDAAGIMEQGETFMLAVPNDYWEDTRSVLSASETFFAIRCPQPVSRTIAAPDGSTVEQTVLYADMILLPIKDGVIWFERAKEAVGSVYLSDYASSYFMNGLPGTQKAVIGEGDAANTVKTKLATLYGWCQKMTGHDVLNLLFSGIDPDEYIP